MKTNPEMKDGALGGGYALEDGWHDYTEEQMKGWLPETRQQFHAKLRQIYTAKLKSEKLVVREEHLVTLSLLSDIRGLDQSDD